MIKGYLTKIDNKINQKQFLLIYFSFIIIWSLLFSFQGMNICDEGWVLTGYQQIFNDPSSVEYLFLYYLSVVVGGVWNLHFGCLGIYCFRILSILIVSITAYIVYLFLYNIINRWYILLGFILIMCYSTPSSFHHNQLACLLSILCAYNLYLGLKNEKSMYILLAGIVFGINIFSRLPNIVVGLLVLVLIPYAIYQSKAKAFKYLGLSICGTIIGILIVVGLMLLLGHLNIFLESISDIMSAGGDPDSNHNIHSMLHRYIGNYLVVFKETVFLFSFPVIAYCAQKIKFYKSDRSTIDFILLVSLILIGFCSFKFLFKIESPIAFLSVILIASILVFKKKPIIVYSSIIALLVTHCQCVGGDQGFGNMGAGCLYLSFPMAIGMSAQLLKSTSFNLDIRLKIKALFTSFFLIFCLFGFRALIKHQTYYENSPRWTMLYKPNAKLATTLISKENKIILDSALVEIRKYVKKNDYLLCIDNIPMINYLTETRPYLYNSWVWTYDPSSLRFHIKKAERNIKVLPVILRGKGHVCRYYDIDPHWNDTKGENNYEHNNKRVILYQSFIERHHYRKVWENSHFLILLPPNKCNK